MKTPMFTMKPSTFTMKTSMQLAWTLCENTNATTMKTTMFTMKTLMLMILVTRKNGEPKHDNEIDAT
jgi:hypothetical protein